MGKSKSRIFRKVINNQMPSISRNSAIEEVVRLLNSGEINQALKTITLFGLCAEEVLEAGASYEVVTSIKNVFK